MRTHACVLLLLLSVVAEALGSFDVLRRWSRQAIHCQPGDKACQKCSASCSSVELSSLPECCEVYNTCCDDYFQACKKCSSMASQDVYFPEYCCASFTDCCELVTTLGAPVKDPEPVKAKTKPDLKIPTVAAPKPSGFPGAKNLGSQNPKAQALQGEPTSDFSDTQEFEAPPRVSADQSPDFQTLPPEVPSPKPKAPEITSFQPRTPSFSNVRAPAPRTATRGRVSSQRTPPRRNEQVRPHTRQQSQRRRRPDQLNLRDRKGRVTSRGRLV